ncbi:hypothetical protein D3C85_233970 [compost metagenome]
MSKLAAYLPSMEEEQYVPEIRDDHTEFSQFDVTTAGAEVDQALADHSTTGEIIATLESILDDIEAADTLTPQSRVFIGHSIQSVQHRIGLVVRTPSMEANDEDSRQISMEGIAQGLAKLWEGTVALIRKILLGIRDFFAMLFGFGKRKEKRIKLQLEKAKDGGAEASISKLVEKNLAKHVKDIEMMKKISDNLAATALGKERPDQLVLLSPASAQIVVRESDGPVDTSRPMTVNGQDIVAMRKKDVKALEHMTLGHAKHALITAMTANGKLTFTDKGKSSVLMSHADVNEMVWDTAFRGKEVRDKAKGFAAELMKIAVKAEKAFTGDAKFDGTKTNVIRYIIDQTKSEREAGHKILDGFTGSDKMMPCGSNLVKNLGFKDDQLSFGTFVTHPVASESIGKHLKIKFPQYGDVKKAADGIVTVTLLSNFNGSIDAAMKSFDDVLKVYERLQAWAISNAKDNPSIQRQVASAIRALYDEPVKWFTSYARAVGLMESVVIGWGDSITNPLSKLTDSRNLMLELA